MTKLEEIERACLLEIEHAVEYAEESGMDPYLIAKKVARAAVEAMREPTQAMREAGGSELPLDEDFWEAASDCWSAMIDSILNEKPS